jgi:hypothetical protein
MAVENRYFVSGSRVAVVFPLDQITGRIAASSTTPLYGYIPFGFKGFAGNFPPPRKITHVGQDGVRQLDFLPPVEAADGSMTVSSTDLDLIALVTGVSIETLGTSKIIPVMSSQMGFEPVVGVQLVRQAENVNGLRRWESFVFSAAKCIYQPASFTDAGSDITYQIAPMISGVRLWGPDWTTATNGATTAQMTQFASNGFPYIVAWKADGTATDFLFDVDKPATNTTTAFQGVWKTDPSTNVCTTASVTNATTKITFAVAPAIGTIITCLYEGTAQVRAS